MKTRFNWKILFFLWGFFPFFLPKVWAVSPFHLTFLDVGEGEAIYLETSTHENLLIDAGNPISGYYIEEFLKKRKVESLNAVFITHPHQDHMGGIFQVIPRFRVKTVYDNGQPIDDNPECDIYRWYKKLARKSNYRALSAGETIRFKEAEILVLWPPAPVDTEWNNNSLVLKLVYGKISFLLMGDANSTVEQALLDRQVDLKAQVLKVGHHGAADATSSEFLEAVSPDYAVISVDKDNVRGYPSTNVLKKLENRGVEVFLTYLRGNITFRIEPEGHLNISFTKK